MSSGNAFTYTIIETGEDGRALFREAAAPLAERKPNLFLSDPFSGSQVQLRESPPDFEMGFHCPPSALWTFVLQGRIEYGLQDGTRRAFGPGDVLFVNDLLPEGASFDGLVHGHCSRALSEVAVKTALVRVQDAARVRSA